MSKKKFTFLQHFNWRVMLLRILANAVALALTAILVPKIYFVDRTLLSILVLALGLGLLNALVKPVVQFLTLGLIFASGGFVVVLINTFMLWLLARFFPDRFAVTGFVWALVGGALIGILGSFLESLLGVTPPIMPDESSGGGAVPLPTSGTTRLLNIVSAPGGVGLHKSNGDADSDTQPEQPSDRVEA